MTPSAKRVRASRIDWSAFRRFSSSLVSGPGSRTFGRSSIWTCAKPVEVRSAVANRARHRTDMADSRTERPWFRGGIVIRIRIDANPDRAGSVYLGHSVLSHPTNGAPGQLDVQPTTAFPENFHLHPGWKSLVESFRVFVTVPG